MNSWKSIRDSNSDELMKKIATSGSITEVTDVPEDWRTIFRTAHDISPEAHVRIQAAFQKYTDNAVSKTVNFPENAAAEDVEKVYRYAYDLGCKGITIYRDKSRESQVLNVGAVNRTETQTFRRPRIRPQMMGGLTRKAPTGCGNLYVTINDDQKGPFELFAQIGKAGGCAASQTEAIGRLTSLALRAGVDPGSIARQLRGVRCPSPIRQSGELILSCADAIGRALENHLTEQHTYSPQTGTVEGESFVNRLSGICPDCGAPLEFESGCSVCRTCGYSKCS
jgi:ribonucleoside-diphosphate reductase alpha chain